ncbi:hypothetical protein BCY91_06665 [Pelobium manganitolerans]|uniref:Transporter n=1 Tax=Pelobium manganitolerans TaxID=1842495 RepID=A0A419S526_9SPHI|nr:TolC family protein [Pelobium manganitolerans]RKD15191.1 hypothetical protein BCY91_06665 [Pelobium manganitolerans]
MIKQKLYLTAVLMLLVNLKSYSQERQLPLSEAWEAAFSRYPGLTEKQALIRESEYQKRELQNDFLPNLQLQLQNSYGTFAGSTGAFFPLPGTFNVSGNPAISGASAAANTFGSVLVDWRVFEFGRQRKAVQAAKANIQKAESTFDATKLSVQAKVSRLYSDILYTGSKQQWAKDNAERVKEIVELSKTLADAGLKPGADTLLAASSYLQTLGELDDWTGRLEASKVRLTELVPINEKSVYFGFSNYLSAAPLSPADTSTAGHPYLNVISDQVENDKLRAEVAARKLFPSVSVLGGLSSRGSGIGSNGLINSGWSSGFNNQNSNYLIGVGLTWNISSAFNSITERNRIKQQQAATQSRFEAQSLQLNTGLQSVNSRLNESRKQVEKTNSAVDKARKAYDLYLSRYQNGLINLTELLQIQLLLQQSEKVNIEAYQQFWDQVIARSELSGDFSYLSNQFK